MKTIKEFKSILRNENGNTVLGLHLHKLISPESYNTKKDLSIHNLDEKIELIVWMNRHGLNVFETSYKIGNITWAYHTWQAEQLSEYSNEFDYRK